MCQWILIYTMWLNFTWHRKLCCSFIKAQILPPSHFLPSWFPTYSLNIPWMSHLSETPTIFVLLDYIHTQKKISPTVLSSKAILCWWLLLLYWALVGTSTTCCSSTFHHRSCNFTRCSSSPETHTHLDLKVPVLHCCP